MDDIAAALERIIAASDFMESLGWLMVTAICVGAILDDDYRSVVKWIIAGTSYVVMLEFARQSLLDSMSAPNHVIAIVTDVMAFLAFTIGISIGWSIAWFAKKRGKEAAALEKKNGNGVKNDNHIEKGMG